MRWNRMVSVIGMVAIAALASLCVLSGCKSGWTWGETESAIVATKEQTNEVVTTFRSDAARLQSEAEQAREAGNITEAEDKATAARLASSMADKIETGAAVVKVNSQGQIDWEATTRAGTALLPPPFNTYATLLLGVFSALGGFKWLQWKRASVSIVESVDTAMRKEPRIMEGFKALEGSQRAQVRESLTPTAKAVIDKVSTT